MNRTPSHNKLSRRSARVVAGLLTAGVFAFGAQGAAQAAERQGAGSAVAVTVAATESGALSLPKFNNDWQTPGGLRVDVVKPPKGNNDWQTPPLAVRVDVVKPPKGNNDWQTPPLAVRVDVVKPPKGNNDWQTPPASLLDVVVKPPKGNNDWQ